MVSLRYSFFSLMLSFFLVISDSNLISQESISSAEKAEAKKQEKKLEAEMKAAKKEEKENSKKNSDNSNIETTYLIPEIEKSAPNYEMGKNAKVRGVTRAIGSSQKVLDLLLPDKKKLEEIKILSTAKKGEPPFFIPCDSKSIPIVRITNTRYIDEKFPMTSENGSYLVYEGWHHPESGETAPQGLYCTKLDDSLGRSILVKNGYNSVRPFFHPNLSEVVFSTDSYKDEFHIASVTLNGNGNTNLNLRKLCRDVIDVSVSKNMDYAISYFKEGKLVPSIGMVVQDGTFFPEIAEGREVSWSSNGERIAFTNLNGAFLDIYTANRDGSDLLQVTTHFGICHRPSFSPDGQWLVFSAMNEVNQKYDLFIVRKDGKDLTQVTMATEEDRNPYWGKDGWIYFETDRFDGNTEIAKIDSSLLIKKFADQNKPPVFIK